jgi:polysaccharide export outer membrane protein
MKHLHVTRHARLFVLLAATQLLTAQLRPSLMEEAGKENLPAQRLGVDDLVAVSVYDSPELTRTVRVESDGSIHLPLLKDGVPAAGILPRQLESGIIDALKNEQILVDPIVKVTVAEYHSRPISVMGAVRRPVTFQAVGAVTLLDALARAEGLALEAGTEIIITREQLAQDADREPAAVTERISVKRLLNDADPAVNYTLHGGENIRVPEAGKIFVVGNVHKPGAFPVRDASENSILKMVAVSEGLMPYAGKLAYVYRRKQTGVQEIPIELEKIMQRKAPDVALEVDDVLYIPDNKHLRSAMTVIDRISMFGGSTASGLVIWH